ncbi:hypothetical protein DWU98_20100, partial [Dyella monticola]
LPSICSFYGDYHRLIEQEIHLSGCSVFRGQLCDAAMVRQPMPKFMHPLAWKRIGEQAEFMLR